MRTNFGKRKGGYVKKPKARLSLWVLQEFYDRLEADSLDVSLSTARKR